MIPLLLDASERMANLETCTCIELTAICTAPGWENKKMPVNIVIARPSMLYACTVCEISRIAASATMLRMTPFTVAFHKVIVGPEIRGESDDRTMW